MGLPAGNLLETPSMTRYPDLEDRIRQIGAEIYSSAREGVPSFFDKNRWLGRVMERAMKDETFKFRLFRYIDVLPSLRTDTLVVRMLKEYFSGEANLPLIIRQGIKRLSKGAGPYVTGKVIRAAVESLARQFIAGENPEDAVKHLRNLWKGGLASSVDLLGEVVVSEDEAKGYRDSYVRLLNLLYHEVRGWNETPILERDDRGPIPRIDISIKASSLYSQLDPVDWEGSIERTKKSLEPLFIKAKETGASVCFDMEHYYLKDLIIALFKNSMEENRDYDFAGIALQAYLRDSREDLLGLIEWARARRKRITVRLVKGAYWDYETAINRQKGWPVPVFLNKEETDRNFEELTGILLENSEFVRPAIATHNIRSVCNAIARADFLGLPGDAFEFQMLYGMGEPVRRTLKNMGYRVRVYAPVGELIPGMAYLVRRLLENTSNESFVRLFFAEGISFDEMIRRPEPKAIVPGERPERELFRNEPPTDFSKGLNRERMQRALTEVKKDFGRRYPLFIGSEEVFTDRETSSTCPADPREVVGRVSLAERRTAERAIEEAKVAWEKWRKTPPASRAEYLFRTAREMRRTRFELAALEIYETGKTWKDADADVGEAIDYLEYYGREMIRVGTPAHPGDYPGEENEYRYEPRGIGVVISPWNFPLAIPAGMVSAGIVSGNCVIFKPSGLSPVTGWKLVEAFRRAGLPPGVLQFLSGSGDEIGEFLVSHPETDFIAFTGSRDVGLGIIKRAGETRPGQRSVKKVIAEMGGKNAIIVDETADLDEAVTGVLESSFGYQGQKCSACSRLIAVDGIFDDLLRRLGAAMESIRIGPPEAPGVFMGPVINEKALEKIRGYVDAGKRGGKVLFSRKAEGEGYFVGPVIFGEIDPASPVAQEEIFGPVLIAVRAKDMDEAIRVANSSPYALTGGIYSRSPSSIRKAKDEFRAGNLYINRKITGALVGRQPFGGFGMSGIGSKAGGPDYVAHFMNAKSISENTLRKGFHTPPTQ